MNPTIRTFIMALAALAVAGCAGIPVETDYDRTVDFRAVETFAWLEPDHSKVDDPMLDSELLGRKVRRSVIATLVESGLHETTVDDAQLLVTYHTTSRERIRDSGPRFGFGISRFYHRGHHTILVSDSFGVESYQEGSLIIDMIDARSNELLWRGWTRGSVRPGSYTEESVDKSIRAILARFPPE